MQQCLSKGTLQAHDDSFSFEAVRSSQSGLKRKHTQDIPVKNGDESWGRKVEMAAARSTKHETKQQIGINDFCLPSHAQATCVSCTMVDTVGISLKQNAAVFQKRQFCSFLEKEMFGAMQQLSGRPMLLRLQNLVKVILQVCDAHLGYPSVLMIKVFFFSHHLDEQVWGSEICFAEIACADVPLQ